MYSYSTCALACAMLPGGSQVCRGDRVNGLYSSLHVGVHKIPHTDIDFERNLNHLPEEAKTSAR